MMQDLLKALPDDRPVTGICIVEDQANCPPGYQVVDRTFDQDIDADLWKDGFWSKRITRYICLSKDTQLSESVIETIGIIGERDPLPSGHDLLLNTKDTDQRAMRKKQLCFRSVMRSEASQAVTDVIVLSKNKRPPPDFTLAGEVNNLVICFKAAALSPQRRPPMPTPSVPYNYPIVNGHSSGNTFMNSGIDGVPFDINPKLKVLFRLSEFIIPTINVKTAEDISLQVRAETQTYLQYQYTVDFSLIRIPRDQCVVNCKVLGSLCRTLFLPREKLNTIMTSALNTKRNKLRTCRSSS